MEIKDKIDKDFAEMAEWSKSVGIHPMTEPSINCSIIAGLDYKSLSSMDIEKLEEFINSSISYSIYIKYLKSSIESQLEIIKNHIDKVLFLETSNLGQEFKYKSIDEKISIVRTTNSEIDEYLNKISILRSRLFRIKDISFAIDKKTDFVRTIYNKKLYQINQIKQ